MSFAIGIHVCVCGVLCCLWLSRRRCALFGVVRLFLFAVEVCD